MEKQLKNISKFMSLVLRHKPEEIGLQMDENGWADVDELISKLNAKGIRVDMSLLDQVVETNDKKRFAFNEDKTKIRASQGHSINVDLGLEEQEPPEFLYHGTADHNIDSIKEAGIVKRQRQHVHLSATEQTAIAVGSRHGKPVVLTILAGKMHQAGLKFYLSANGVWLTEQIPAAYIIV